MYRSEVEQMKKEYGNIADNVSVRLKGARKVITGTIFGYDGLWDGNEFYQYMEVGDKIYTLYFHIGKRLMKRINEGADDLGSVDYSVAYRYTVEEIEEEEL